MEDLHVASERPRRKFESDRVDRQRGAQRQAHGRVGGRRRRAPVAVGRAQGLGATRSAHEIADEAVQIFGGRALTQTGMGKTIEMFHRTYKFDAILGGAEGRRYFPL